MTYDDKLAECEKYAAQEIVQELRSDPKLMREIIENLCGEMTDIATTPMIISALNGDANTLLSQFVALLGKAIKHEAEYQAIAKADAWEESDEREHAEKLAAMDY